MASVLVTGGAGYIGSHMTYALLDRGESVIVLDNLSTGVRELVSPEAEFVLGDVGDRRLVSSVLRRFEVDAVIHFAGSIVVPESVADPLKYYANNTSASRALIESCVAEGVGQFVFSSTAAVYGMPETVVITEETPQQPINPYGRSKLMTEWMLKDTAAAHDFRYAALRYFNVSGADPQGRTGQSTPNATHLIKRAIRVALGLETHLDIFGTDYPTSDGTGVRDYIHVADLVDAHLKVLDALRGGASSNIYNCGYGRGLSVREIVVAVERAAGRQLATRAAPRRAGDPAIVVADSTKLKRTLGWVPRYDNVDVIVRSALEWEQSWHSPEKESTRSSPRAFFDSDQAV
jgi:UDP-glucose 4-epimerase